MATFFHVIVRVFPEGAADQVLNTLFQRVLLFLLNIAQAPDVNRNSEIVPGFRHGKTLHVITVAVVALRVDIVIHGINKRL